MPTPHLQHGQVAMTGAAVAVASEVIEACSAMTIRAHSANVGKAYVGLAGVTTATGYELAAGEAVSMDLLDASDLYVIGTAADRVSFLATLV